MKTDKFYNIIDGELEKIIQANISDETIKKNTSNNNKGKGYAALIWFLDFYGQKSLFKQYITDGKEDFSCDIIFSDKNYDGEIIYYVIQSKWVDWKDKNKPIKKIDKDEFGKTLNDFETILRGDKGEASNEKFNQKYEELVKHLESNGKAKFIFFTLADSNGELKSNIDSFNKEYYPTVFLEIIDINRIRRDYIEFKYKEIKSRNPLAYTYDSEKSTICLPIERFETGNNYSKKDFLEFDGKEKAYIFLLRPKTIYDLFERFRFSLFFNNVRNPLIFSNYNKKIEETLKKKPGSFWYFNNGITAITKMIPEVGKHAKNIELGGLQIINGAQTVYSIHRAYANATELERRVMDNDARVTFRLIRSSDEDFNLEITKYTNFQNPMQDRDFMANEETQLRLQNESFETNHWLEKRRGEFRIHEDKHEFIGVKIIPNDLCALAYIVFHLQQPVKALQGQDMFFISHKEDKDGLYEFIFNKETKYSDILASFHIWQLIFEFFGEKDEDKVTLDSRMFPIILPALAFSKIVLRRYFQTKFSPDKEFNLSLYINKSFEKDNNEDEQEIFTKALSFSIDKIFNLIKPKDDTENDSRAENNFKKLVSSNGFYESVCDEFGEADFTCEIIEEIELSDEKNEMIKDEIIDGEVEDKSTDA